MSTKRRESVTARRSGKLDTMLRMELTRLQGIIRRVRNRWRLKVALRGAGLLIAALLVTLLAATWGLDALRYRPWAVVLLGVVTYGALAWGAWRWIGRPLLRPVSDQQVALFIEERAASMQSAMVSAVEFGTAGGARGDASPRLVEKLVEQALQRGSEVDWGRGVDREGMRRTMGVFGAASLAVVATLLLDPAFLRLGAPMLLRPWAASADTALPFSIAVTPGNGEVARGADQIIEARLVGFGADRVELSFKRGAGDWEQQEMLPGQEPGAYELMLLRLGGAVEYVVEADGVRSPLFRLDVVDVPHVERIDLELRFPAYTGLPVELVEDGGDIAAVAGTVVGLHVVPTVAVSGGRLQVEPVQEGVASTIVALEEHDGVWVGDLAIESPGFYRVELQGAGGEWREASGTYVIDVLADQPPIVRIDAPGRDLSVTAVEEVWIELSAADDYALEALELIVSANGADEMALDLGGRGQKEATGSHVFYLEELELQPGDFISYWARARDRRGERQGVTSATDIYFLTIRSFGAEVRQADAMPGGGGGGGERQMGLSRQQREIIAATFKLVRDAGTLDPEQRRADIELLAGLQAGLRDQTIELSARTGSMGIDGLLEGIRFLEAAAEGMDEAADRLGEQAPQEALPPEQRALQQLQRFEAMVRDIQVSRAQGQQGGGGDAGMEDLEGLFDIEPDDLANQYEAVQRQRRDQADDEVDEAMQRLSELARRQQQEIERRQAQAGNQAASGRSDGQRQMAEQADELARRLERLAREQTDPELQEAANRLREAAEAMRRAAASDDDRGTSEGTRALNEMQRARRLLDRSRGDRLDRDIADARSRVAELRDAQERMARDVESVGEQGADAETLRQLHERKDQMARDIEDLERQLDDMARESRSEQMQASRALQEAAEFIRDDKLADKVRYSKGVVEERAGPFADDFERGITDDLEQLESMVDAADAGRARGPQERLAESAEEARDLVRRLESLQGRLQQGGTQGEESEPQDDAQAAGGQPGGSVSGPPAGARAGQEMGRRLQEATELRESLQEQGLRVNELDRAIAAMRDLDEEFLGTARGLDQLREEVIDELKRFELYLRRLADAGDGPPRVARTEDVPEAYRAMVQEYFRALAREGERR